MMSFKPVISLNVSVDEINSDVEYLDKDIYSNEVSLEEPFQFRCIIEDRLEIQKIEDMLGVYDLDAELFWDKGQVEVY